MNETGYTILKLSKFDGAYVYAKDAREFATGATGSGAYLNTQAVASGWYDVEFVNALHENKGNLPKINPTSSSIQTGTAVVIGGATPIGDLRGEADGYIAIGGTTPVGFSKGTEYSGAFYAIYKGTAGNWYTGKIGIGTQTTDITTSGYYEGDYTTRNIHEFQTSFTADSADLTKITTGSGVYTEGGAVSLQFTILNRNGEQLSSASQIAADPFISGQKISILNTDSSVAFADYRIGGDSIFNFTRSQNVDVFGSYTRNFGIKNEVVNQDGGTHTSEFYLYANTASFDKIFVKASGKTVLNENYTNHSPPDTSSISSDADKANAIKYFNNQTINNTGVTGFIELDLGFNENPNFTNLGNVLIFQGVSGEFETNKSSLVGNYPLNSIQAGQKIRLTANDGIPEGSGLFFKLAADTEVGYNEELFNLGPFTLDPEDEGPDLNVYNQSIEQQVIVSDVSVQGGVGGVGTQGGHFAVGTSAVGSTTVVIQGPPAPIGSAIGSTTVVVQGNDSKIEIANSEGYAVNSEQKTALASIGGSIFSTGSMIAGGSGHYISGDFDTIAGGVLGSISGGDFNFIGGGSGVDIIKTKYSVVVGGFDNDIRDGGSEDAGFIGGGRNNLLTGTSVSVIAGGHTNKIAGGNKNIIVGGDNNTLSGSVDAGTIAGGVQNKLFGSMGFIGAGGSNTLYGLSNAAAILGGVGNQATGDSSTTVGGYENLASGAYTLAAGRKARAGHEGSMVFADGQNRDHNSSGEHTAVLDFINGVYIQTESGLFVNGVAVTTGAGGGGGSQNLQEVTDVGNTTTTSILSTGPHISGVTGLFGDRVGIGLNNPEDFNSEANKLVVGDGVGSEGLTIFSGPSHSASINFADGTGGNSSYEGFIQYRHGDEGFRIGAGGGGKMFIGANNTVGIGTLAPNTELEIASSVPTLRLKDSDLTDHYTDIEKAGVYTYLYSRANAANGGFIFLGTAGSTDTEFMRIDTAGQVGIGSNTPSAKLDVAGGIKLLDNNYLSWNSSNTRIVGNSSYLQFQVGASDKVRITSAGNVGIGTNSPLAEINTNAQYFNPITDGESTTLTIGNQTTGRGNILLQSNVSGDGEIMGGVYFIHSSGQADAHHTVAAMESRVFEHSNNLLNGADLLFFTKPRGAGRGSGDPQLFIGSNEEVGIGTGDPACRLHVHCGANEEVARFESEDNDAFIRIKDNTDSVFISHDASDDIMGLGFNQSASSSNLNITSAGNVGIGTTAATTPGGTARLSLQASSVPLSWGVSSTQFVYHRTLSANKFQIQAHYGGNVGELLLNSYGENDTPVGIGTTDCVAGVKLHVEGVVSGSNSFLGTGVGNRITNNGTPYLLSGDSPAENDTLQDVRTRGNSTSTSILSTGPHISGVTGLFSDNVGIGTDSPDSKLHIYDANPNIFLEESDATSTFNITDIQLAGGALNINTRQSNGTFVSTDYQMSKGADGVTDHKFFITGLEKVRIDSDGKVGIGTNNPAYTLEVDVANDDWVRFKSDDNKMGLILADNDTVQYLMSENSALSLGHQAALHVENLNILDGGNVGIGTTDPDEKLEVHSGHVLVQSSPVGGVTPPSLKIGQVNNAYQAGLISSTHVTLKSTNGAGNIYFQPGNTYRGIVQNDGKMGVNTITPNSTLHVEGDITGAGDVLGTGAGNRITNQGVPYLLSGDSPAENDTLQDVTTRGNTTTTSILSTGPHISGISGLFGDRVGIGNNNPQDFISEGNRLVVGDGSAAQGMTIFAGTSHSASLYFADGTVGSAAYQGWVQYRHGNSRLDFGAAGGRRMSLDGNGLAIGDITSPSAELEISSSAATIRLTDSDLTNHYSEIEKAGVYTYLSSRANAADGGFIFFGGGTDTEFMRIETDGDVGIGSNVPSAKLDVAGGIKLLDNNYLTWNSSNTRIVGNSSYLQFQVAASDKVRINSDGHVGIGTNTAPSELTVFSTDSNSATASVHCINNNETGALLRLIEGDNHQGGFLQYDGSANKFNIGVHSTNDTTFANDTKAITIDRDTAKVGIGTTNPAYTLEVDVANDDWVRFKSDDNKMGLILADDDTVQYLMSENSALSLGHQASLHAENLNILDGGNVGIGTIAASTIGGTAGLTVQNSSVAMAWGPSVGEIVYHRRLSAGKFQIVPYYGGNIGELQLAPYGENDTPVGIGTTDCVAGVKLHVEGVVSGSNSFLGTGVGNRITNNGVPYLLSGDSPAETQNLQDVTDNGATTTNAIKVANGTIISGSAVTTPAADLYVFGSGNSDVINAVRERNDASIKVTSTSAGAYFRTNSATPTYNGLDLNSNWFIGQYGYNDLRIVDGTASAGDAATAITVQNTTKYVGIGTTNPSYPLHVRKSVNGNFAARLTNTESTAGANYGVMVDGGTNSSDTSFEVRNSNLGDTYFKIRGDGNVGIGTNNPTTKLEVSGAVSNSVAAFRQGSDGIELTTRSSNGRQQIDFLGTNTSSINAKGSLFINYDTNNDGSNDSISFTRNGADEAGTLDMIIKEGKVGIGSAAPDANLDVTTALNQQHLKIQGGYAEGVGALAIIKTTANGNALSVESATTSDSREIFEVKNSNGTVLEVQGDGNVGIGTSSPSEALDVAGNIFIGTNDIKGATNCKIEMDAADGFTLTNPNNAHGIDIVADDLTFFGGGIGNRKITTNAGDLSIDPVADLLLKENGGNVGIGTDSPQADLHVSGSGIFGIIGANSVNSNVTVAGYDDFGLDFRAHNTWTHWKARVGHGINFKLFNDGISNQNQVLELGKTTKDNAKVYVRSTGAFIEAGMNNSTTIPVVSMGCLADSDHLGGAYLDVRDAVASTHRYEFNRDGTFVASGISVSGDVLGTGVGNRITNNGTPYLLSGDAAAALTLQDVCDNGNTTTTSIGIGITSPSEQLDVSGNILVTGAGSAGPHLKLAGAYTTWEIENQYAGGANNDMFRIRNTALGSDAIVINRGNNRVGVGTTNPQSALEVINDSSDDGITLKDDGGGLVTRIGSDGSHNARTRFYNGSHALVAEINANAGSPTYFNAGDVGIGTTSPSGKLHIKGDQSYSLGYLDHTSDLHIGNNTMSSAVGAYAGSITFGSTNEAELQAASIVAIQTDTDPNEIGLAFFTQHSQFGSTDLEESMRISNDGKVGIGITDPDQTLHVKGIGMIEDASSTAYGTLQFGTDTSRYVRGNSAEIQFGSTIQQLHFQKTNAVAQVASSAADGTDAIQLLARTVHTSANILEVVNGNGTSPIFTIDYAGNVGALNSNTGVNVGTLNNADGKQSVALGYDNDALELQSVAVGYGNQSTGTQSTTFGNGNKAAVEGTAIGAGNHATASRGTALGRSNSAAQESTAVGYNAQVAGIRSIGIGRNVTASAQSSIAIGDTAKATGANSLALGLSAEAQAYRSTAVGYDTTVDAVALNAMAFGYASRTAKSTAGAFGYEVLTSGEKSFGLGHYTTIGAGKIVELGWYETNRVRNSAVRINGDSSSRVPVAMTMHSGTSAPSASTADNGYEDAFSLATNMYSIQRNAGDYVLYHNLGGSIVSTTLGGAEADTLQTVTDRGNTTTTAVNISGALTLGNHIFKNVENSFLGLYGGSDTLTNDGFIKIYGDSSNWGKVQTNIGYDATNSKAHWTLNNTTELMTLKGDGSLGIGTDSPSDKLHVEEDGGTVTIGSPTTSYGGIGFEDTALTTANSALYGIASQTVIGVKAGGAIEMKIANNSSIGLLKMETNKLHYTNGSVGIGLTNPAGDKLMVKGDDNYFASRLDGSTTAGQSMGLRVRAGYNSTDRPVLIEKGDGSDIFIIDGLGNVGIGSAPTNKLDVFGHFSATSKSFLIDHPTKENKKLQYGSLEGPENGVYVRGTTDKETIELPEYWSELVHDESITVVLTPIGKKQDLFIIKKSNKLIKIGGVEGSFDYVVYGERKDIDKLEVEPLKV